jgi:2-C-methyl-D-erythritol 2,4-cyclodiphosphate synthase
LKDNGAPFRVGHGVDVHRLVAGLPLTIGGVTIPFTHGLEGHSDADVLLHAITDAVLGAIGERDIGTLFPNTDPQWRGARSEIFLAEAVRRSHERGWRIANVDATIIAEAPKLAPYVDAMKEQISRVLAISVDQCAIKATTSERMGYQGRGEGVSADAVILLYRG